MKRDGLFSLETKTVMEKTIWERELLRGEGGGEIDGRRNYINRKDM
jgi:hypothetical protein